MKLNWAFAWSIEYRFVGEIMEIMVKKQQEMC